MNNRDRDGLAKALDAIAQRLAEAPAKAEASGEQYAADTGHGGAAFEAGILGGTCRGEADALRVFIDIYLRPAPRRRGKR